jgi:hypothetical protein
VSAYIAMISTVGREGSAVRSTFATASQAWAWLAEMRRDDEERNNCDESCEEGPACQWSYCADFTDTVSELDANTGAWLGEPGGGWWCGTVIGETPGCHDDRDPGMVYTVVRS